jgi:hypothetical protein
LARRTWSACKKPAFSTHHAERHVGNDPNPEKYDPDLWTDECISLNKPGEVDTQSDLTYDYRTNVDA